MSSSASTQPTQKSVQSRIIVVALVQNRNDDYLICKMPDDRGVFPGKWGLPGGGLETGERMTDGLRREMREELGIEITNIKPVLFKDGQHLKSFADGSGVEVYMIFLIFSCLAASEQLKLNSEFTEYAWVSADQLISYDLNLTTIETFREAGVCDRG